MKPARLKGILSGILLFAALWTGLSNQALAEASVPLDGIGLRYFPLENEQYLIRDQMSPDALSFLGADAETALYAMEKDQLYLISFSPEGRQVSLRVAEKPAGLSAVNVFQMDAQEKELFLTLTARSGHYLSAAWQEAVPGYALFSTYTSKGEAGALNTLALSTLYLGRLYSFQTDIIGRAPAPQDIALLADTASRALLLGAAARDESAADATGVPPALPAEVPLTGEMAAISVERNDLLLTLEPIPRVVGSTTLSLSGATAPKAYLRYAINGVASSRFSADGDGCFSVSMPGLTPDADNRIEVTSFTKAGDTSALGFDVRVEWQASPVALSQTGGSVQGSRLALQGRTLPGAKVQLLRKAETAAVAVAKDGTFSVNVPLPKVGENTFTVRCVAPGYRRADVEITVTRTAGAEEDVAALQKKVKTVSYEKLKAKPSAYAGRLVIHQGTVEALANISGQPAFLLTTQDGQAFVCLCADLLDVQLGQSMGLIGTLLGDFKAIHTRWASGSYPALELMAIVP